METNIFIKGKKEWLQVVELGLRIYTASFVIIYGASKWFQFKDSKLLDVSLREATNFQMMWAFFGTTQTYPVIIGGIEVLGGILLFFRKTKLLGALLLTPVFLNIILLDILYEVIFGALLNAIIYQCVFIMIFIQQRQKIAEIFKIILLKGNAESKTARLFKNLYALIVAGIIGGILILIVNLF